MTFETISTPAALIDAARMQRNINTMQTRMNSLGVKLRPHVKTSKCVAVVQKQIAAGASGITVSTLKEAEQFFAAGIADILYAVGMVSTKLAQAKALRDKGCDLKIIVDSLDAAKAVVKFGQVHTHAFEVWLEVDTDGHRAGLKPEGDELIAVGRTLHEGGMTLGGVMTHAGGSYELNTRDALQAMAEQERSLCVLASERLRAAGLPCPNVSVGSTPTALSAQQLGGVTEVRAGVYVFHDLVMVNVGVASMDDVALSVLTTVIGHQKEKGWALVDAGWMAMSRDRGTQAQAHDYGYGQVCDIGGNVIDGYTLTSANQEHGILSGTGDADDDIAERFPVGTLLRILPNHACATAAQFPEYVAVGDGDAQTWGRFYGW
ncbi:MAG: DSD1 family PLP-dependent enzyme [Casimicrobium sp.]|jgi:D-serine deaminase-like pyridoxal phosphate-dependent protein